MITTSVGPLGVGRLSIPATLLRTISLSPATIGRAYSKLCSAWSRCLPGASIRPSRRSDAERDGQIQDGYLLAVVKGARHLLEPDDASLRHREAIALHVLFGLDRVDGLVDLVHLEPDAQRGERRRLHQPDVADGALVHPAVEFLFIEPGACLQLQLLAAGARVDHASDANVADVAADRTERRRQAIHHEPGVHPGAEQRELALLREPVESLGDLRMPQPGIGKLFAGGNDAETGGERLGELAL